MNLNRQQLSFLITLFSMGIVVLTLYNIHLGGQEEDDDDYVVEMVMEEPEELTEEEEKILEELAKTEAIKSHMAFNETANQVLEIRSPCKLWSNSWRKGPWKIMGNWPKTLCLTAILLSV